MKPVAEVWRFDAGSALVAVLDIPGSLERHRTFDVDVSLVVRVPQPLADAWHAMTVEIDGRQKWSRRIASNSPGQTDGLDYHCRLELPIGQALRVRAVAAVAGSVVRELVVEAREDR